MIRKTIFLVLGAAVLGITGCSDGGPTIDPCEDIPEFCPQEGVHRCSEDGSGFQTCQRDANGCLVWSDTSSCGENKTCRSLGTDAACQCNHQCTKDGATVCSSDNQNIQLCITHSSGCLVLENQTDCSQSGKVCYFSNNQAQCVEPCSDQCPAGASQCVQNRIQICSRPERCTEWVDGQDCSLDGKRCVMESGQAACREPCSNKCPSAGTTRCNQNVIQICATASDGCLDWKDDTDCTEQGKYCNDASQPAVCADACQHQCLETELNIKRCQPGGQIIQTCTTDQNNCRIWQNGTDCAQEGKVCQENAGEATCQSTCQNECTTEGATSCDQNDILTCQKNSQDGCLYWVKTGSCSGNTPVCDDSTGEALCVCQNDCPSENALQCNGDILEVCVTDLDADPCLEWKTQQDCSQNGQVCNPNLTPPACEASCTSDCSNAGDKRCDPTNSYIQVCSDQGGCLIWSTQTDCSAQGKTCSTAGGQPECV